MFLSCKHLTGPVLTNFHYLPFWWFLPSKQNHTPSHFATSMDASTGWCCGWSSSKAFHDSLIKALRLHRWFVIASGNGEHETSWEYNINTLGWEYTRLKRLFWRVMLQSPVHKSSSSSPTELSELWELLQEWNVSDMLWSQHIPSVFFGLFHDCTAKCMELVHPTYNGSQEPFFGFVWNSKASAQLRC